MTHLLASLRRRLPGWLNTRTGLSTGVRLLLATGALLTVLLSSVSLYLMFYRLYVPTLLHQSPVYLQYPPAEGSGLNTTAVVSFVGTQDYRFLSTSQAYMVSMRFQVPLSEENRGLGSFMVGIELCTAQGKVVQASWRPALLPYRSPVVRLARTLLKLPFLVVGLADETEELQVDLVDGLYDRHFSPVTHARVSLSKPLQTYAVEMLIRARFTGLRYWMYYWRVPTAVVFVAAGVVWQVVFTAVAWSVLETYAGRAKAGREGMVAVEGPKAPSASASASPVRSASQRRRMRRRARRSTSRSASASSRSNDVSDDNSGLRRVPAL
ncbi:hypothetical protein GGI15_000863 [Coemansia interrupta]|uniref:Seipin n=1 Tax=Coemansia interrupta TaxID=1126814 RepID=A0A9W8LLY0_9FUNG|nr:hypothetical protein GGI15_000863 [Coemansia interrupta]